MLGQKSLKYCTYKYTDCCIRVFVLIWISMFEGILNPDGRINNKKSINRLAQVAVAYAQAGEQESLTYHNGCHSLVTP